MQWEEIRLRPSDLDPTPPLGSYVLHWGATGKARPWSVLALFHCMVRHGTVRYGSLLGGFPLGTVPGTWYFFSTTSVEVPSSRTVTKTWRVNSADHWMAGENRHYCVTELATRDPPLPARFKSAQPAKDRTQLLFKQTHIFASTTK